MSGFIHLRPSDGNLTKADKTVDETLLLQSQIAQLKHPKRRVLSALQHFFQFHHPIIHGKAKDFLKNKNELVAVKSPAETDCLSDFLRRHMGRISE